MNPCELPPCPPCPPPPFTPCPQRAPAPPPQPPCRTKPIMRGLHWAQTKRKLVQAITLSCLAGAAVYFLLGQRRIEAYKDFYAKAEVEEWADEMARKGLFQSVPPESLKEDNKK